MKDMIHNYLFSLVGCLLLLAGCDLNDLPEDPLAILPSQITEDLVLLERLSPYFMEGYTTINPGVTLTIEPGTKIIANHEGCSDEVIGSCTTLIVSQGASLIAQGTSEKPIYFTSENERRGDWGGIVINGNAPCNTGANSESLAQTGRYCSSDPDDSSGILQYVVVEYAGAVAVEAAPYYPSSFTFQGVGSGTVVEHVYAKDSEFNGFAMIGGNVNLRYALGTCIAENTFAWHDGWQGNGQFWISQQCSDRADSGIYGANIAEAETDLARAPRSNPIVYNFTLIGPSERDSGREGIELTLGTGARLFNGVVLNHRQKGFWINDRESCEFIQDGSITLSNVFFFNNERDFTDRCGENALFLNDEAGNLIGANSLLQDPFNEEAPNLMLNSEGMAFPADQTAAELDWFMPADFVGGIGEIDWTLNLRKVVTTN